MSVQKHRIIRVTLFNYIYLDLNEDGELELLDSDIKDLKKTNMMEESQVIKMKAELACLEGKVCSYFCLQWVGAAGLWYQGPEKD